MSDNIEAKSPEHATRGDRVTRFLVIAIGVYMNGVEFHLPVFVGDVVSFWTSLVKVGRTSITMHVDVEAERRGEIAQLTEAEVTYVAVDLSDGERRPVPIRGASMQSPNQP